MYYPESKEHAITRTTLQHGRVTLLELPIYEDLAYYVLTFLRQGEGERVEGSRGAARPQRERPLIITLPVFYTGCRAVIVRSVLWR